MDKQKTATDILNAALPLIVFEGWDDRMLEKAASDAGYNKTDLMRVFPQGVSDAIDWYAFSGDQKMKESLHNYNLESMKYRARVALAVRLRIQAHGQHKEAARKTAAFLSLPHNATTALHLLYRTVDSIWYALGDNSTDFNFYTKRLTLAAVYSSTFFHWLDDTSPDDQLSWEFLERRIDNVMQIGKAKAGFKDFFKKAC